MDEPLTNPLIDAKHVCRECGAELRAVQVIGAKHVDHEGLLCGPVFREKEEE